MADDWDDLDDWELDDWDEDTFDEDEWDASQGEHDGRPTTSTRASTSSLRPRPSRSPLTPTARWAVVAAPAVARALLRPARVAPARRRAGPVMAG
jgi:hypothetical protein